MSRPAFQLSGRLVWQMMLARYLERGGCSGLEMANILLRCENVPADLEAITRRACTLKAHLRPRTP